MFTEQTSVETVISGQAQLSASQSTNDTLPSLARQSRSTFRVSGTIKPISEVLANSYDEAANIVAFKVYGCNSSERDSRINSYSDLCGYFQAINVLQNGKSYPVGKPFHLQRIYDTYKDKPLAKAAIAG